MVSRKASAAKRTKLGGKLVKKAAAASAKRAEDAAVATAAAVAGAPPRAASPDAATTSGDEEGRVLYIGHLPHGFYEAQLRGYFSQFGTVTKVRVSRNKKTGRARHTAFLEFASPAVARVAADAMDGYLMFASRLAVKVVPPARVHPALFKGANRTFSRIPWRAIEAGRHNAEREPGAERARAARAAARDVKRAARIKAAGIDYQYDVMTAEDAAAPPPTPDAMAAKADAQAAPTATRGERKRAAAVAAAPQPAAKVKAVTKAATVKTATAAKRAPAAAKGVGGKRAKRG